MVQLKPFAWQPEHGDLPSHLLFLLRHSRQAVLTLLFFSLRLKLVLLLE
jgi:hypothetical protein